MTNAAFIVMDGIADGVMDIVLQNNLPSLEHILRYQHPAVLQRYAKDYPQNKMPPREAFSELMKYMWLCLQHARDQSMSDNEALAFTCDMHVEMAEMDDMWHTFLLFTKDYADFCEKYLGAFFHHEPFSAEKQVNVSQDNEVQLQRYLTYIAAHLGDETLIKWFAVT